MTLGRLEKITDLRQVWKSEAQDFTPWLAKEENLALLGDTISLDLELETVEEDVGPFRADILCKETANDSWVLVENQVERTDHTHLGQLLTYAAGLNTVTIVWIAKRFTDEHRAALDWQKQYAWLVETLDLMHKVFSSRVKQLNADDWQNGAVEVCAEEEF